MWIVFSKNYQFNCVQYLDQNFVAATNFIYWPANPLTDKPQREKQLTKTKKKKKPIRHCSNPICLDGEVKLREPGPRKNKSWLNPIGCKIVRDAIQARLGGHEPDRRPYQWDEMCGRTFFRSSNSTESVPNQFRFLC